MQVRRAALTGLTRRHSWREEEAMRDIVDNERDECRPVIPVSPPGCGRRRNATRRTCMEAP